MKGDIYEHENGLLDCQIGNSDIVQHFFQAVKKIMDLDSSESNDGKSTLIEYYVYCV